MSNEKKTTPVREFIQNIGKTSDQVEIDKAVLSALREQYERAKKYQISKGRTFELTWEHFQKLATPSRRKKMADKMRTGNFERFMKSNYGYVITWRTRDAYHSGIMSNDTAIYLNREDAKRAVQFGPGDTHSEESIELIRKARTGTTHKEETKIKISVKMTGRNASDEARANMSASRLGKKDSEETKLSKSAAASARWARVRAEKEKSNGAQ